jgi:VWFA-related protein
VGCGIQTAVAFEYARLWLFCAVLCACAATLAAQEKATTPQANPGTSASASDQTPELTAHESVARFKVTVRLVLVRVVARDAHKHVVRNLTKDDFLLYDNGKPQTITKFSIETPGAHPVPEPERAALAIEKPVPKPSDIAERYIIYLFDDLHLNISDLIQARVAALQHLAALPAIDRAAIFTTSGMGNVDFTSDRAKFRDALMRLMPRGRAIAGLSCPYVSYYMADLIVNRQDPQALAAATADAQACGASSGARLQVLATASQMLALGDSDTRLAIDSLNAAVRRLSAMPGQRMVVLVSPGFLVPDNSYDVSEAIDRALRANVVISSLDARGLYVIDQGPAAYNGAQSSAIIALRTQLDSAAALANNLVLEQVADETGGTFFHNNNDLLEGLRQTTLAPECYYVLGFSPQKLKLDGRFHKLKVKVNRPGVTLQARKGYFAPKHPADATQEAQQEIDEAVFSREEVHDLPVELHTQYFKSGDNDAKLAVLVHVRVKQLHFDKVDGRNRNNLTIVSALFDRDGKFVTGQEKVLQMRWKDETLANKLAAGITLKSSFDVKPGAYQVRLVVRDDQGQLAAENDAVEIPY